MKNYILSICFTLISIFNAKATVHEILVMDFFFEPSDLKVFVGDTIKWTWIEGGHTTTSLTVPSGANSWNAALNTSNNTFSYVVTVPGAYTYECLPHTGSMTGSFSASVITGIQLSSIKNERIYPNPCQEILKFPDTYRSLKIYAVSGELVINKQVVNDDQLDISSLSKGVYFIQFVDSKGGSNTSKFVRE